MMALAHRTLLLQFFFSRSSLSLCGALSLSFSYAFGRCELHARDIGHTDSDSRHDQDDIIKCLVVQKLFSWHTNSKWDSYSDALRHIASNMCASFESGCISLSLHCVANDVDFFFIVCSLSESELGGAPAVRGPHTPHTYRKYEIIFSCHVTFSVVVFPNFVTSCEAEWRAGAAPRRRVSPLFMSTLLSTAVAAMTLTALCILFSLPRAAHNVSFVSFCAAVDRVKQSYHLVNRNMCGTCVRVCALWAGL